MDVCYSLFCVFYCLSFWLAGLFCVVLSLLCVFIFLCRFFRLLSFVGFVGAIFCVMVCFSINFSRFCEIGRGCGVLIGSFFVCGVFQWSSLSFCCGL